MDLRWTRHWASPPAFSFKKTAPLLLLPKYPPFSFVVPLSTGEDPDSFYVGNHTASTTMDRHEQEVHQEEGQAVENPVVNLNAREAAEPNVVGPEGDGVPPPDIVAHLPAAGRRRPGPAPAQGRDPVVQRRLRVLRANPERPAQPRVPWLRRVQQRPRAAGGAPRNQPRHGNPARLHDADNGEEEGRGRVGQDDSVMLFGRIALVPTLEHAVGILEEESTASVELRIGRRRFGPIPTTPADQRAARADAFRRFVELLGNPNGRAVTSLSFKGLRFSEFREGDARTRPYRAALRQVRD